MKFKDYEEEIGAPEGVSAIVEEGVVAIKGRKGEVKRKLVSPKVEIAAENNRIIIRTGCMTKREKKLIGTFRAHIKNMIRGANEGHTYRMKICSGHFPMNVTITKGQLIVKNFLGEKIPRTINIEDGVDVRIDGPDIVIEGIDKEKCGRVAGKIELLTRRPGFDKRIFQDGIYITEKDGKSIG